MERCFANRAPGNAAHGQERPGTLPISDDQLREMLTKQLKNSQTRLSG